MTKDEFMSHNVKDSSLHHPGKGRVYLCSFYGWGKGGWLDVIANGSSDHSARVAYVALEEGAPKSGTSPSDLKTMVRTAGQSLTQLDQTTMPELLEPIRRLIRAATSEIKE